MYLSSEQCFFIGYLVILLLRFVTFTDFQVITDLLKADGSNLKVRNNEKNDIFVENLSEVPITSPGDALICLQSGERKTRQILYLTVFTSAYFPRLEDIQHAFESTSELIYVTVELMLKRKVKTAKDLCRLHKIQIGRCFLLLLCRRVVILVKVYGVVPWCSGSASGLMTQGL